MTNTGYSNASTLTFDWLKQMGGSNMFSSHVCRYLHIRLLVFLFGFDLLGQSDFCSVAGWLSAELSQDG